MVVDALNVESGVTVPERCVVLIHASCFRYRNEKCYTPLPLVVMVGREAPRRTLVATASTLAGDGVAETAAAAKATAKAETVFILLLATWLVGIVDLGVWVCRNGRKRLENEGIGRSVVCLNRETVNDSRDEKEARKKKEQGKEEPSNPRVNGEGKDKTSVAKKAC